MYPYRRQSSGESDDPAKTTSGKHSTRGSTATEEHTIIVRVYDRFENMGTNKVVVKVPAQ